VEVVVDVWQLVASRARALGTALEVSGSAADCAVQMDVVAFRQICLNLLLNSLQTEPPPTRIIIGSNRVEDVLEIRFEDDGPGFRPEALERGFEPLFTTRAEGTGLGLAIVSRLAAAHGAEAVLGEGRHGGAAVTLRWPIDAERRAVS
jgi:signal transduction histidine kinase